MLCFLYVTALTTLLGICALLLEPVLPAHWPRRGLWGMVIVLSIVIPVLYQAQHATAVSLSALDPGWWARGQAVQRVIMQLWLPASGLLFVWGAGSAWWVRRQRTDAAIVDGVPVLVTEALGPATVGVFRSQVMVPRWVLTMPAPQRRYVLQHEDEHRKANDARLLFLMSLALLLTPWNVALWWVLRRLSLAVELDCDKRVVKALGDARTYSELLFKVAQATSRGPRLQPGFLGRGMLERRLRILLAPTRLRGVQRLLLPAAALALLYVVLTTPHPVLSAHHSTHVTMTTQP